MLITLRTMESIFIFLRDDTDASSDALCVPNNYCYVSGKVDGITGPLSKTLITAHEVGHCLGLLHTFHDECVAIANEPCNTVGDLVCDTPPESQGQYSAYSGCTGINPPLILKISCRITILDAVRNILQKNKAHA